MFALARKTAGRGLEQGAAVLCPRDECRRWECWGEVHLTEELRASPPAPEARRTRRSTVQRNGAAPGWLPLAASGRGARSAGAVAGTDAAGGATDAATTWHPREVQDLQGLDGELELTSGLLHLWLSF